MEREFLIDIAQSGFIHKPLPLHTEKSLEATLELKEVLAEKTVWQNSDLGDWTADGSATLTLSPDQGVEGGSALAMTAPFRTDGWTNGIKSPATYTNYSTAIIKMPIGREDWRSYNRISCYIKPDFPDNENVHMIIGIHNDGEQKLPDRYWREGFHVVNLQNHAYNHVIWEFQDMPRDCVTQLMFYCFMKGYNGASGKECLYYFDNISLQKVEHPDHAKGWCPAYETIMYSTAGYDTAGTRIALTTAKADTFTVKNEENEVVYAGEITPFENEKGKFGIIDFTAVCKEGNYCIEAGSCKTALFPISKDSLEDALWRTINFLFCQRCGYPIPGVHSSCHHDMFVEYKGLKKTFNGGWHDAGDMSQFSAQTVETAQGLFEAAAALPEGSQLRLRLMEEGEWGIDHSLRTRLGDGYRMTHVGAVRYTDNMIGTFDDIPDVTFHNHPMDNFIHAGALAYSGSVLRSRDKGRAEHIIMAAKEDFAFAIAEYERNGYTPTPEPGEHTYPSGESQFYCEGSIAASMLYKATGEEKYAAHAVSFADLVAECQETDKAHCPIVGFFYRDKSKKYPQHFNHQSRESLFMRTFVLLCETQPDHPDKVKWERIMQLYAAYLKDLRKYAAPFGMIPSGVYALEETADPVLFKRMNFACDYEEEYPNWVEQIKNGVRLNDNFYVRCYPVWFSFRGNAAVLFESGKAASMLGKYFEDEELLQIARDQLYWNFGLNPSVQSIMYGHGHRYCQQYAISSGELTGELPVGMESFGNEDIPYWPQGNNCTYKEIWTSPSRSLLWMIADLL